MDIPFYALLIAYFVALAFFLLWTFFNLYHIVRFGMFDFTGKLNTFLFLALTGIIFFMTAVMLKDTPWFDTFPVFKNISFDSVYKTGNGVKL